MNIGFAPLHCIAPSAVWPADDGNEYQDDDDDDDDGVGHWHIIAVPHPAPGSVEEIFKIIKTLNNTFNVIVSTLTPLWSSIIE